MSLVVLKQISKDYAGKEILHEISCSIEKHQRIGLIGRNGVGKSTLLKILAGLEEYSHGELSLGKGLSIGYLEQDPYFSPTATLFDEMLKVFGPTLQLAEKLHHLERLFATPELAQNTELLEKHLNQYGRLQEQFELAGGYKIESKIRSILFGLQFTEEDLSRQILTFSGGERIRASFGKLLLKEPDLLLLDEPTNHLDLRAIEWIEEYLLAYPGSVLIVSHDRVFLDRVVNMVYELDTEGIHVYHGNYSTYLKTKEQREAIQMKTFIHQQEKIQQLENNISRFKAGTRARQTKNMEKRLKRMELVNKPHKAPKAIHLQFNSLRESGRWVLECKQLAMAYATRPLFERLDLKVERGERIAIIGPNGSGKSTLLSILAGQLKPTAGELWFGPEVEIGYFSQHFDELVPNMTIYENIYRVKPMNRFQIRSFLGLFLFSGEDVEKTVATLSGGEKNRVALATLIARQPNLLLLDEPTNHLDLSSRNVLVSALRKFSGTIIFVSHDRYLIQEVATRKLEFPLA